MAQTLYYTARVAILKTQVFCTVMYSTVLIYTTLRFVRPVHVRTRNRIKDFFPQEILKWNKKWFDIEEEKELHIVHNLI